jgi:hypothetical protein
MQRLCNPSHSGGSPLRSPPALAPLLSLTCRSLAPLSCAAASNLPCAQGLQFSSLAAPSSGALLCARRGVGCRAGESGASEAIDYSTVTGKSLQTY